MNAFAELGDVLDAARRLGAALEARGKKIATAESCTGGLIATALTELAGSSFWFERGFVTYSNEAKHELLGVPQAVLAEHGAVSIPVARAMAEGALARSRAFLAVAVTGVAGPGGGSAAKPVGTVCFAWALGGGDGAMRPGAAAGPGGTCGQVVAETRHFSGDRAMVRAQTARYALERALALLATTGTRIAQAP